MAGKYFILLDYINIISKTSKQVNRDNNDLLSSAAGRSSAPSYIQTIFAGSIPHTTDRKQLRDNQIQYIRYLIGIPV